MDGLGCQYLIDSGGTHSFVSLEYAEARGLQLLPAQATVRVGDGREVPACYKVRARIRLGTYEDDWEFLATPGLTGTDAILGYDWLHRYNPVVHWRAGFLEFQSYNRAWHKLQAGSDLDTPVLSAMQVEAAIKAKEVDQGYLVLPRPQVRAGPAEGEQPSAGDESEGHPQPAAEPLEPPPDGPSTPPGSPRASRRPCQGQLSEEAKAAVVAGGADIMVKELPPGLPPHREIVHRIPTVPGATPPNVPCRRMSPKELEVLQKELDELSSKGFIEPSTSPYGAPCFFVRKKIIPGIPPGLRFVQDYRRLNAITIPNACGMSTVEQHLQELSGSTVFSTIDCTQGFYQIRIAPEDCHKTAFRTPGLGHWEFKVVAMGLQGSPATFTTLVNQLLGHMRGRVCCFMDDILVHSKTEEQHAKDLAEVFSILRKHRLYAKYGKCHFFEREVEFLGHRVSADGIRPSHDKTKALREFPVPHNLASLRSFLGLANWFRKFVPHFSHHAAPLNNLTKKDTPWEWGVEQQHAFEHLRAVLASEPVLTTPDWELAAEGGKGAFVVYSDASNLATGAVLLQDQGRGLQPIAYDSCRHNDAQTRYPVHDLEMLGVQRCLGIWRHYLQDYPCTVLTDHHSLQFYDTKDVALSARQQRWSEKLQEFPYLSLKYIKGESNVVADALSRSPGGEAAAPGPPSGPSVVAAPASPELCRSVEQAIQRYSLHLTDVVRGEAAAVVGEELLGCIAAATAELDSSLQAQGASLYALVTSTVEPSLYVELSAAYQEDTLALSAMKDLQAGLLTPWELHKGLLYFKGGEGAPPSTLRMYVPATLRQRIVREHHDTPFAGHLGKWKTLELVKRRFYWPGMGAYIEDYVLTCPTCQAAKTSNRRPAGLLQSLPKEQLGPWEQVGMDFITQLPKSRNGYDSVVVFTDHFTKMVHFAPCRSPHGAQSVARQFAHCVVRLHGWPKALVSDRDSRFTARFWRELHALLDTRLSMSTAYHPQTDGQTERVNRVLEEMMRSYIDQESHDNWDELLWTAEFAYNNSWHSGIGNTPFRTNYGRDPHTPAALLAEAPLPSGCPAADEHIAEIRRAEARARAALVKARERDKRYADERRRPHTYEVGDRVLLETEFLSHAQEGPAKKLRYKYVGPFKVIKVVSPNAVKLALPPTWRIHPVINMSRMQPYRDGEDMFEGRLIVHPNSIVPDASTLEWERVEKFVGRRTNPTTKRQELLVQWRDAEEVSFVEVEQLKQWCKVAKGSLTAFSALS